MASPARPFEGPAASSIRPALPVAVIIIDHDFSGWSCHIRKRQLHEPSKKAMSEWVLHCEGNQRHMAQPRYQRGSPEG